MTQRQAFPAAPGAELPAALASHFSDHATIGMPDLARLLPMDAKTLRRHIAADRLVGRLKGIGRVKRHRVFTPADIARFLQALEAP